MTLATFLLLLVIAGICGAIGQSIAGVYNRGFLVSIVIGFIGALLGIWLANALGLGELFVLNIGGQPFPIVWSVIGSTLLAVLVGLFTRRSYAV